MWAHASGLVQASPPAAPTRQVTTPQGSPRPASGAVRVRVTDATGAALVAALVTLRDETGQARDRTIVTSDRGEATFDNVPVGSYSLLVQQDGFDDREVPAFRVGTRRVTKDVELPLARFADEVQVTQDEVDRYLTNVFSNVLTQEQIDQLPDDPDDMEQALKDMAGPGAQLAVNGFRGGRLPPKSQIREIRFRFDPYDAEFHEPGFPRVDISTKAGQGTWRNNVTLGFRDEALNARNVFAPYRGAEQTRRYAWAVDGPLVRGRTSFSLNVTGVRAFESQTIVAAMPAGALSDVVRQPTDRLNATARVEHTWSPTQFFRFEWQHAGTERRNLGVGDFELADHAYTSRSLDERVRASLTSTIRKRYVNELRAEWQWLESEAESLSDATTIVVPNAFTTGGAQMAGGRRTRQIEVTNNLDFSVGTRHALRAGVWATMGFHRNDELRNANGTFTFASLELFRAGRPTTYAQRVGTTPVEYGRVEAAWYVHDTIRAGRRLQLGVGVRHELQSQLGDWNNLAPRASFTWVPTRSNTTTLRGGVGVFNDWYEAALYEQTLKLDGVRQTDIILRDPGYPDAALGGIDASRPPSIVREGADMIMPRLYRASFGVEQQLTGWLRLRTNAALQRGAHLLRSVDANAPVAGTRPDPRFGTVAVIESTARSSLKEVSAGLNLMAMPRRLFGGVNYRLAWDRNDADDAMSLPSDSTDPSRDWGPSRQDVRHQVFGFFSSALPKGLRLGLSYRYQSALPYTMSTGFDDNGDTVLNDRPSGVGRNTLRGDAQQNLDVRVSWGRGFGGARAVGGGPQIMIRRAGDDMLSDMPGGADGDRAARLEVYVQAYNALNSVNLQRFTGVRTSPFFGQATSAAPARRLELGVRVGF